MRLLPTSGGGEPTGEPLVAANEAARLALTPADGITVNQTDTEATWIYDESLPAWNGCGVRVLPSVYSVGGTPSRAGVVTTILRTRFENFTSLSAPPEEILVEFDMLQIAAAGITNYGWVYNFSGSDVWFSSSALDLASAFEGLVASGKWDATIDRFTTTPSDASVLEGAFFGFDIEFANTIIVTTPGTKAVYQPGRLYGATPESISDWNGGGSYDINQVVYHSSMSGNKFYKCIDNGTNPEPGTDSGFQWEVDPYAVLPIPFDGILASLFAPQPSEVVILFWAGDQWMQVTQDS